MRLSGQAAFEASPDSVWEAALRPDVLERCLPDARTVEPTDTGFQARLDRTVASVHTEMTVGIDISQDDRPDRVVCELQGEDERTASTVDGTIRIDAAENDGGTTLSYEATLTVTGRLSSLGPRLLKRQLTSDLRGFFDALEKQVERRGTRPS